jgi:hypothetical protein
MMAISPSRFIFLAIMLLPSSLSAGPPYVTDDPEAVQFRHWEFYLACQHSHTASGWSGTAPHFEVNYGVLRNIQLHIIIPLAYDAPRGRKMQYGVGDGEIGLKYEFVSESSGWPMIGIFPMLEVPTGDRNRNLGNGKLQVFLPLWLQNKFGLWSTYGGVGYLINPGSGNRDSWYWGWQLQRQFGGNLNLGAEVYLRTAQTAGEKTNANFNLGIVYDTSNHQHLLISAGRSICGRSGFQCYFAYQLTWGPGE